jgi:hypothetical protein
MANLYLARDGAVWVLAAGATNTNGKGHDSWMGGVPDDSMNLYAIGIEMGNNGSGEPYTAEQADVIVKLCATLCQQYNIPAGHVRGHVEWSPGRKIDPAGPSPWAPFGGTWDMAAFRASVAHHGAPNPPETGDEEMLLIEWGITLMITTGTHLAWINNGHAAEVYGSAGIRKVRVNDDQLTGMIQQSVTTTEAPYTLSASDQAAWNARRG